MTSPREIVVGGERRPLLASDAISESSSAAPARLPGTAAAPACPPGASRHLVLFTLVASLGGLLFGYDTGVISGALPYLRDDLLLVGYQGDPTRLATLQEVIVSSAIVAAALGSASGGLLSDRIGRKHALLAADVLFTAGAAAMAAAGGVATLVAGRVLVGLGVGLASVTVPVFIAEAAPPALRGRLVTINVFFITGGQFLAYLMNYFFSFVPHGAWRWMLGAAAVPSVAQMAGLLLLPESPAWLAAHGRVKEAQAALAKLQPGRLLLPRAQQHQHHQRQQHQRPQRHQPEDNSPVDSANGDEWCEAEAVAAAAAPAQPGAAVTLDVDGSGLVAAPASPKPQQRGVWRLLRSPVVLRELHVGVGLQVLQQVAGINTIMYYTPNILELSGFHNKQTALLLALIPAGTNALGTLLGAACIDRFGRRQLLLTSVAAVAVALAALGAVFHVAEQHSPAVLAQGSTCPAVLPAPGPAAAADCTACLHAGCGFCGRAAGNLLAAGTCLALASDAAAKCANSTLRLQPPSSLSLVAEALPHMLYLHGCPSAYTWWILGGLLAYLLAFAPGLGPIPWAVNSEIYPTEVRGLATGVAATANWLTNAVVAQTFLTLTQLLGGSGAFWLYALLALVGLGWVVAVLPETSGLSLDDVQQLFSRQQWQRQPSLGLLRWWRRASLADVGDATEQPHRQL